MTTQDNWRWCNKCEGLAFAGHRTLGSCAGGGEHDHNGSGNYTLTFTDPGVNGQSKWKWCHKCEGLTFTGRQSFGVCPAGGLHEYVDSGDYTLVQNVSGAGQSNWRFCAKCQSLTFAGHSSPGACAAGGQHDCAGSGDYSLVQTGVVVHQWRLNPMSAGKVDFNGGSLVIKQDGNWQFFGSLHDNSTWYGDDWALGFVIGNTGHGGVASGNLGAKFSGGPVDGTFNLHGQDPWIAQNWQQASTSIIHTHLHVSEDLGGALGSVLDSLKKYGPTVIQLAGLAA